MLAMAAFLWAGLSTVSGAVPTAPWTRSVTLAWDANVEPDIASYRLYYGTRSREYSQSVDAGTGTTAKIEGLTCGAVYFFAVTAWNEAGLESGFSNEVEYLVPADPPPVAGADAIRGRPGQNLKVAVAELLANDTGPDPDRLAMVGVSPASAGGGTVSLGEGWVFYLPTASLTGDDSFTYTLSDGMGGTVVGTVSVTLAVEDPGAGTLNQLGPPVVSDGKVQVQFLGIPNRLYGILRKASITDVTWEQIGTAIADATGLVEFVDEHPPPGSCFYRTLDMFSL